MNEGFIQKISYDDRYTQLDNTMLQDNRLSFAARGLLAYILSLPKTWKLKRAHLANTYQGDRKKGNGREAVNAMFDELLKEEYIVYRKGVDEKGQWVHTYYVFPVRFNDFQKMFPNTDYPFTVEAGTVNPCVYKKEIDKKRNKEDKKEDISPPPIPKPEKEAPSPAATEVCNLLHSYLKKENPHMQIKSKSNWTKKAEKIVKQYKGNMGLISDVINWIFTSDAQKAEFWRGVIQSPESLYNNIDKIIIQMNQGEKSSKDTLSTIKESEAIAKNVEKVLGEKVRAKNYTYVVLSDRIELCGSGANMQPYILHFKEHAFKEQLMNEFKKRGLI